MLNKTLVWLCLALMAKSALAVQPGEETAKSSWRFDMGQKNSPVSPGTTHVTPESIYSPAAKFGWLDCQPQAFDIARPMEDPNWLQPTGQVVQENYLIHKEHSDLTRDGVTSKQDLVFQVDVPNGLYDLGLTLGRLDRPVCSLQVSVNGKLEASDFDAKHWVERKRPDRQFGFPRNLRRTVQVTNGRMQVRVHGDDAGFRRRFDQEYDKPGPGSYLEGTYFDGIYRAGRPLGLDIFHEGVKPARGDLSGWGQPPFHQCRVWAWQDIGGPFTENSILSIEIHAHQDRPLVWKDGVLIAAAGDQALQRGATAFGDKNWQLAEKHFDQVADAYSRSLGYLWLAGRPEYEHERRLLPQAIELLAQVAGNSSEDYRVQVDLENARRLARAIHRFDHRGELQRSYTELILAAGEVNSLQPEDPLYYKSRIYAGRAMYMIIPHRWTFAAGVGRQYFEELERAGFTDNRFVRWFLHDEWKPQEPDWIFPDYSKQRQGAPAWAGAVYEAFNREIDLGEWWIRNRQQPDGSLGGGWGDDVEILRTLGAFASVCPDASPELMRGVRLLVDGVWNSGSIDREAGYFAEVDDAEHGGEWTGDTLTSMTRLDHGNPVYIERAMKTGKLMRDLWMDHTPDGLFMMRSNYLGATGVGLEGTHNDSRINFRCASPARSVLRYNRLPALQKLYLEWADTWWAAAMSTDRGKPRGVIPEEIGYPSGIIGGNNSPTWYEADHPPNTENGNWGGSGGYQNYIVDLFLLAHELTKDARYLEPLRLQAAYAEKHLPASARESIYFREGRLHASLWESHPPGSPAWIAGKLSTAPRQWQKIQERLKPKPASSEARVDLLATAAKEAEAEIEGARRRLPHTTSEAMATDRVHFPGMKNAVRIMTGAAEHGEGSLVSYHGLGRQFAAAVLRADAIQVRVVVYNFDNADKEANLVCWTLRPGDEFDLTAGTDHDHDTVADKLNDRRTIRIQSQAQEIPFRIPGRTQVVLDLQRSGQGSVQRLLPDVALTAQDIIFRGEFGKIEVAIHNIGASAANDCTVILLDEANRELGRQTIPHLAAPEQLDPQIVRVGFPMDLNKLLGKKYSARVEVGKGASEITLANNQATATCPDKLPPRKIHSHP
jgi:hypothetical protein